MCSRSSTFEGGVRADYRMNPHCLLWYLLPLGLCLALPETDWLLDPTSFEAKFEELNEPPLSLRQGNANHLVIHD